MCDGISSSVRRPRKGLQHPNELFIHHAPFTQIFIRIYFSGSLFDAAATVLLMKMFNKAQNGKLIYEVSPELPKRFAISNRYIRFQINGSDRICRVQHGKMLKGEIKINYRCGIRI